MSFFGVTVRNIEKVWNHPNADRLDLAQVSDSTFQFVVGRDEYKIGDRVLYFPVDSVLPEPLIATLGLTGRLSGKEKNRIKTVKLRGEISQGIVARPEVVFGADPHAVLDPAAVMTKEECFERLLQLDPEHLTMRLGITKYEAPMISSKAGNLVRMPDGIEVYDIEGADNYPRIIEKLMHMPVSITEKLEGMNFWISMAPCISKHPEYTEAVSWYEMGEISVGQRHHEIKPIEGVQHDFWKVVEKQGLDRLIRYLACEKKYIGKRVTLRGEFVGPGVQKNIYKLKEHQVYIFDVLVDGKYLNPQEMKDEFEKWGNVLTPPALCFNMILEDWLAGRSVRDASNGQSLLDPTVLREGIVIKPMVEDVADAFGRLFIKQRSPEYLAGSDL